MRERLNCGRRASRMNNANGLSITVEPLVEHFLKLLFDNFQTLATPVS